MRLGVKPSSNGAADFGFGVGSDALVSIAGHVPAAGATRYYQAYYRDPVVLGSCGPTFTFNITNANDVLWN